MNFSILSAVSFYYIANERSNFAVAESITALLKDLPEESSSKNFGGDSNRSSVDEPHQQVLIISVDEDWH